MTFAFQTSPSVAALTAASVRSFCVRTDAIIIVAFVDGHVTFVNICQIWKTIAEFRWQNLFYTTQFDKSFVI